MSSVSRPRPKIDADSRAFWEACCREELLGQRCGQCSVWRWPPRQHCPSCHAADPVWEPLSGTGRVVGYVVVHRPMDPAFADEIPLTIVHVEMDGTDGEMVLISNLRLEEGGNVKVGAPVRVKFEHLDADCVLPKFILQDNRRSKE